MPRKFALLSEDGTPTSDVFTLPRVTEVIDEVLGKKALVGWAYRMTLAGAIDLTQRGVNLPLLDIEEAKALMRDFKLTPNQLAKKAADRGTSTHDVAQAALEEILAGLQGDDPYARARKIVAEMPAEVQGYGRAVMAWVKSFHPQEIEGVEKLLVSTRFGYTGRLDLCYVGQDGLRRLIDLKTSKAVYESHKVQVASAYKLAWEEMFPSKPVDICAILLARPDGTYDMDTVTAPPAAFLHLLALWHWLQEDRRG